MPIRRSISVAQSVVFAVAGVLVLLSAGLSVWFRLALATFMFGQSAFPLFQPVRYDSQRIAFALLARYILLTVAGVLAGIGLIGIGGWGGYIFAYGAFGFAWAFGWVSYRVAKELRHGVPGAKP